MRPVASNGVCGACPDIEGDPEQNPRLVKRIRLQRIERRASTSGSDVRGARQKYGGCVKCAHFCLRLEWLLGPAAVRRTARLVQNHPGAAAVVARTKKKQAKKKNG